MWQKVWMMLDGVLYLIYVDNYRKKTKRFL